MPKTIVDTLRPFLFHGVSLAEPDAGGEAIGTCPWCGKRNKFYVNVDSTQWRCWACETGSEKGGGNKDSFIPQLWSQSFDQTKADDYKTLATSRKLCNSDTPVRWGLAKSVVTGDWLAPGYTPEGKLKTVYRYMRIRDGMRLIPTPTIEHQIHGVDLLKPEMTTIVVTEGLWDGMALWETLSSAKSTNDPSDPYVRTANSSASAGAVIGVVAVPSCKVFKEEWTSLFSGKDVILAFDNDHPLKNEKTGKAGMPAGFRGAMRAAQMLLAADIPPSSVRYLAWGGRNSKGYDPDLPHGFDVRDLLTTPGEDSRGKLVTIDERVRRLKKFFDLVEPIPPEWAGEDTGGKKSRSVSPTRKCDDYRRLVMAWRKALKWTDGLDCALSVMLAAVSSVNLVGDQLWVKIIGPASCGKSTLCEAVSTNARYVMAKSTIRGFHSGYSESKDEDCSLISRLSGKALVTKDGDTLLQSPNLGQILAEARDIYDCTSRTHYRNKVSRDYDNVRMVWLLCGTNSLRSIDQSELGERFLDCVIMEGIDDDLEDDILWRVANRVDRNLSLDSSTKNRGHDPELDEAMQMTGGYIDYLRAETAAKSAGVENPDWAKRYCTRLGKYVAIMRARPSAQDESQEREFAARLTSQMVRLSKCLAIVLQKSVIDEEVMQRVRKVADDTARGVTRIVCEKLYENPNGLQNRALSLYTAASDAKIREMTRFLRMIKVIDLVESQNGRERRWVLTPSTKRLMDFIKDPPGRGP